MPDVYTWAPQSQDDQPRFDQSTSVSEWIDPSGGGSISRQVSQTTTWSFNFNVGINYEPGSVFKAINASVGGGYSTSQTEGEMYTFNVGAGQQARIVYTPRLLHVVGFLTETQGGDFIPNPGGGPPIQTQIITVIDHQPGEAWIPQDGGIFRLQYSIPAFYSDYNYQGTLTLLDKGNWDVNSFPNDTICSASIPNGYTVELFSEPNFQGRSITLLGGSNTFNGSYGVGENWHFGDDWARQASSIRIS